MRTSKQWFKDGSTARTDKLARYYSNMINILASHNRHPDRINSVEADRIIGLGTSKGSRVCKVCSQTRHDSSYRLGQDGMIVCKECL